MCVQTPVHSHILERRRSAALCMMKPCIGYDFSLTDIHIHAWLSGRMYKIVAAALTAQALGPAAPSELQHFPVRDGFLSGAVSEQG